MHRALVVCALALAAAGMASAADAPHVQQRIVPGKSIGHVVIGMSLAEVRRTLGAPEGIVKQRKLTFGARWVEYGWQLTSWRVAFRVDAKGVSHAVTIRYSQRKERTKQGIGVGSLGTAVERAFGVRCLASYHRSETATLFGPSGWWCVVGPRAGYRTAFIVGRVCLEQRGLECDSADLRREVLEVAIFGPGEELPVWLDPNDRMPNR